MLNQKAPLAGKVAIVTGGGRGVGRGIAIALSEQGASVVLTGRTESQLTACANEISELTGGQVSHMVATVGERHDADRTVATTLARFGRLDILVNNAQSTPRPVSVSLELVTDEIIAMVVNSGLIGAIHHMQAAFAPMKQQGGGSIINIASNAGILGHAGMSIYGAAKEGLKGLSRVAARDWGGHGIRVNAVCPASLTESAEQFQKDFPERATAVLASIPLGRLGDPVADIGRAVAFLAGPDASYITGQTWSLNGGQMMT
ncbi:SDR family NAD(P)-dependent oxidoreductase [Novosphingobium taihuense]|uniref:NAD(P)-dependent dehydrogenase (Short-subunit alcohol dehydrogenase family) n=1 Tax=Novosphingobium taihuense TaxID=260085 RepID=A0A7W7ADD9_9SPHN|nr:SDR family oxidoreductase [Novosphingobium taihuense]MBB4614234.1 NAD(P)-dependent dehydrogenase (short-subunit alcohol dehydrogenase family) [Novosphingobium taihuense]TWH87081.1 NAD(P)-dependent dehydrogenase (short-subunit alcohol dehydrogenase family) [Novosphingobium taihuense]